MYKLGGAARPLFPPHLATPEQAQQALLQVVRRDPRTFGLRQTRWTLAALRAVCDWLTLTTLGGLARLLQRLHITWQRGRSYIHSPDPAYVAKLAYVQTLRKQVAQAAGAQILVYLDEVTVERHPTVAYAYEQAGTWQPLARRSVQSNTGTRVVATLEATTGRVCYRRASHITLSALVHFYRDLCAAYPDAERIYVVQDNWPLHFHPDVLVALEPQVSPWPFYRPSNWSTQPRPTAQHRYGDWRLPIQVVTLPTYASWTNPIEKLWRKLRQEVTHLHRWADDLLTLRTQIDHFLDQFAGGSRDLLRYVGLLLH